MAHEHKRTYRRKSEPTDSAYRRALWDAAFGLQGVDSLQPSAYARSLADDNVSGRMSLDQVGESLNSYYRQERRLVGESSREEEADKVSHRIVELLEAGSFALDAHMLPVIHARLFQGIDDTVYAPGSFKNELLIKCERVLNGDSVLYGNPTLYQRSLDFLFSREMEHAYAGYADGPALSWSDAHELARFIANVWLVHPFYEGNTRTVAVFLALYLRSMGFEVNNEPFQRHAAFFRNALVRATYQNRPLGVGLETGPLVDFVSKLADDPRVGLDYDSLWCLPLFRHPEQVRNVSLADAAPMQARLIAEGTTQKVLLRGGHAGKDAI